MKKFVVAYLENGKLIDSIVVNSREEAEEMVKYMSLVPGVEFLGVRIAPYRGEVC